MIVCKVKLDPKGVFDLLEMGRVKINLFILVRHNYFNVFNNRNVRKSFISTNTYDEKLVLVKFKIHKDAPNA